MPETPAPAPVTPAPATPTTPAPDAGDGGGGGEDGGDDGGGARERPATVRVAVDTATTFDPLRRLGIEDPPRPEDAVDGDEESAWRVPVGDDGQVRAGLLLTLDRARALRELEFDVLTPGLTVRVLATDVPEPPAELVELEPIATLREVGTTGRVALAARYRQVLLWVTEQPADTEAAITEVRLRARR